MRDSNNLFLNVYGATSCLSHMVKYSNVASMRNTVRLQIIGHFISSELNNKYYEDTQKY